MYPKQYRRVATETQQFPWRQLRTAVTTGDATVVGVTTRNFANKSIGTGDAVEMPHGINNAVITFLGKPADQSAAFSWKLYGYRAINGMAELIAYGTGNLGDVAATVHPVSGIAATDLYYADYLTITAQTWLKTVSVVDIGASSGEVAKIQVDIMGLGWLLLELTNCAAGEASETDQLEAILSGC